MLDPRIILSGQQQADPFETATKGIQLGQGLRQLLSGRQAGKMAALAPEERQAFANNSMFSRELNAQLKADKAAEEQALRDQLKFNADLAKTYGEVGKIGAETGEIDAKTGKLKTDTGITRQNNHGLAWAAVVHGGPNAGKLRAKEQLANGLITQEQHDLTVAQIDAYKDDLGGLQKYAFGQYKAMQDPKYSLTTADNELDNETAVNNNIRTTNASIYATDTAASTADKNREQQQSQFDANLYVQQNKPLDYFTAADGTRYAVYANGQGIPVSGPSGEPVKAQQPSANNSTIQKAILETDDTVSATKNAITNLKDALKYSEKAYDGVGAARRATARGFFGEDERATATTMLDNIVTGNALEMLKATFGSAPTEGERAILLQLQGSANMPRAQREAIYNRAIQMAEARLASNQQKASELRSGTYFTPQQRGVPYADAGQSQQQQSTFNLFD